jgi:hypothetical protein
MQAAGQITRGSSTHGIALDGTGHLHLTTDGGLTWTTAEL